MKIWDIDRFKKESSRSEGKMCSYGFSYNSGTNENFLTIKNKAFDKA